MNIPSTHYKAVGLDNRGTSDFPFGYIYLRKKRRGGTRETPGDINPRTMTDVHAFLEGAFPALVGKRRDDDGKPA